YDFWWFDSDIQPLSWTRGVVQLQHNTYNPFKVCPIPDGQAPPGYDFTRDGGDGTCGPNTWHWGSLSISSAVPFTILKPHHPHLSNPKNMDWPSGTDTAPFPAAAPANAFLRFVGPSSGIEISFDDGATWIVPTVQGTPQPPEHPESMNNYFTSVPEGTV